MRILLPVLVVALFAIGAFTLFGDGSEKPPTIESAQGLMGPFEPFDACAQGCGGPTVAPSPTPCPYCNQQGDRWNDFTAAVPPTLLSNSAVLMEASCGEVIFGLNARTRREPASLTKIATAMAVIENTKDLQEIVPITINGWELSVETDSSIMGLLEGMNLTVEELLYGLLLPSGNDAALQLSEHMGGEDSLVNLMNQRVQELGLTDTILRNSHGLDADGAYSTPFDMAVLGRELLKNPVLSQIVATEFRPEAWHELGGLWNGNYLMYIYEDAIGIKTGYTEEAGWNIVSAAQRDGRVLIASVFDSSDVYWDSMQLFDWAFENVSPVC